MKSNKFLSVPTLLLSAGILFTSCKKDDAPISAPVADCRIITITPNSGGATHITYNSSGKVASVIDDHTKTAFGYNGNTIIVSTVINGSFGSKKTITLNANGLATNVKTETSQNGASWFNDAYEYNGTELVKEIYTSSLGNEPEVTTVTWSGGNLISTSGRGVTTTVDYYNDKPGQMGDYLNVNQLLSGFYIYRTKNLIKSFLSNGEVTSFDYTFDGKKITGLKMSQGNSTTTYSLEHECK